VHAQPHDSGHEPNEVLVALLRARKLPAVDTSLLGIGKASSDPQVVFRCDGSVAKSTVKKKNLNPIYRERSVKSVKSVKSVASVTSVECVDVGRRASSVGRRASGVGRRASGVGRRVWMSSLLALAHPLAQPHRSTSYFFLSLAPPQVRATHRPDPRADGAAIR